MAIVLKQCYPNTPPGRWLTWLVEVTVQQDSTGTFTPWTYLISFRLISWSFNEVSFVQLVHARSNRFLRPGSCSRYRSCFPCPDSSLDRDSRVFTRHFFEVQNTRTFFTETYSGGELGTLWQEASTLKTASAPQVIPNVMFTWAG